MDTGPKRSLKTVSHPLLDGAKRFLFIYFVQEEHIKKYLTNEMFTVSVHY